MSRSGPCAADLPGRAGPLGRVKVSSVDIFLLVLAAAVWISAGLIAFHSFLGDIFALLLDATRGDGDIAQASFERWKATRNLPFVYAYFLLTGPFSLLVVLIATRGFRTGFRR